MAAEPHISEMYTKQYVAFLKSFIYDDVAFEDNATELTLGTVMTTQGADRGVFREDEILAFGMPERKQLSPDAIKRLRKEVHSTIQTIAELFYANDDAGSRPPISQLPDDVQAQVDDINAMQLELQTLTSRITTLQEKTRTAREELALELEQLVNDTLPAFTASRNASIDLLAATLEATIQKLNSIRETARKAFYTHQVNQDPKHTVSRAISIAYRSLLEEEEALKGQAQDLDRQIQEYEDLLRLVDGNSGGGYQQIVDDWVKVKRETDECLKDLRRLGWTGD